MNKLAIALAALALAADAAGLVASPAEAGSSTAGSLSISSRTLPQGASGLVEIRADVEPPGLGRWTIDVTWDVDVVDAIDCVPTPPAVCSTKFGPDTMRTTGFSDDGLVGNVLLANVLFECGDREGESPLTITINVFADATPDDPVDIDPVHVQHGAIVCAEQEPPPTGEPTGETPSASPAPAATATVTALPETGTGSTRGSSVPLVAVLATAGLAGVRLAAAAARRRA